MSLNDRKVTKINECLPADKPIYVAAYCRVGEKRPDQASNFDIQNLYYRKFIEQQINWVFSGLYMDEGSKKRSQFNAMLADARTGKLNLIIVKSVSRFCWNLTDSIFVIHDLQRLKPPVGVYFENEDFFTLQPQADIILFLMLVMAESEREKRSQAAKVAWNIRKIRASNKEDQTMLSRKEPFLDEERQNQG